MTNDLNRFVVSGLVAIAAVLLFFGLQIVLMMIMEPLHGWAFFWANVALWSVLWRFVYPSS